MPFRLAQPAPLTTTPPRQLPLPPVPLLATPLPHAHRSLPFAAAHTPATSPPFPLLPFPPSRASALRPPPFTTLKLPRKAYHVDAVTLGDAPQCATDLGLDVHRRLGSGEG